MNKFRSLFAAILSVAVPCVAFALMLAVAGCCSKDIHTEDVIDVNGVSLVYAVDGPSTGKPVILVHGNGGSHHSLDSLSLGLQDAGYLVYGLDSRGQGANAPLDEYHYTDMAEDVYQFILAKKLRRPAMFGHSDGGIIGLELELMHPGTLRLLAAAGANIFPEGVLEESLAGWKARLDTCTNPLTRMMVEEPQIAPEELNAITAPVLVTAGESDLIRDDHTRLIAANLPNSELVILEGEGHSSYIKHGRKMIDLMVDFMKRNNYR